MKIGVVDYGASNLKNIFRALDRLGLEYRTVNSRAEASRCHKFLLPGVGSFGKAMQVLIENKMDDEIRRIFSRGQVLVGLCLGLQLLFDTSEEGSLEHEPIPGLGLIAGKVVRIAQHEGDRVPRIGWFMVRQSGIPSPVLKRVSTSHYFFAHSYHALPERQDHELLITSEGGSHLVAGIRHQQAVAFQFHPECSGRVGLEALRSSFLEDD